MLIVIYSIEIAGPGLLVLNGFTSLNYAIFTNVIMFSIAGIIALILSHKIGSEIGGITCIIMGFTIFLYPWYGLDMIMWGFTVIAFQIIGILAVSQINNIDTKTLSWSILVSHYTMVAVMFLGLTTESYLLIPGLTIFLGLVILATRTPNKPVRWVWHLSKINNRNKIYSIFFIFLFASLFLPTNTSNEALEENNELIFMSYNIHFGISGNGEDNADSVIDVVKFVNPTIIAFQEVTFAASINGYRDMYTMLKHSLEPLGYKYSYFSEGGKYQSRNAIFSKLKITDAKTQLISPRVIYERNVIEVKIENNERDFLVYATHLTHVEEKHSNPDRVKQAENVIEIITQNTLSLPVFILGDFNAEPLWEEINVITESFNDTWSLTNSGDKGYTWPNNEPRQRIDYIFNNNSFNPIECRLILTSASDHLPVVCSFEK
jgi:endonuclease/exonuclease/phosphatase family metal-dependent hydrolase